MEKYTESDILKLEMEIRSKQAELEAMKLYHSAYADYEGRINNGVHNDFAYDDLIREYDRIKEWLIRELGLVAEGHYFEIKDLYSKG